MGYREGEYNSSSDHVCEYLCDATANSDPACRYAPFPANRTVVDPITLQKAAIWLPSFFASLQRIQSILSLTGLRNSIVSYEGIPNERNSLAMKASAWISVKSLINDDIISAAK